MERVCSLDKSGIPMRGGLSIVSTYFAAAVQFAGGKYDLAFLSMLLQDTQSLFKATDLGFKPCTEIYT